MLSSFLISQHFSKDAVDPTLFTQKVENDLLLVQIYVDDIIFASTNTAMCNEFANMMTTKFKMSMMGQMSFFLGLQIFQSPKGIFLNQSKYASEIIKKYGLLTSNSVDIPMVEKNKLDEDLQGTPVDATLYRGMIRSLMYLTSNADHAGCQDTRSSTSGNAKFLGDKLVSWSSKKQKRTAISITKAEYIALSCAITLCCNNIQHSTGKHIDTSAKRKIQFLDREARYEKHVSENAKTSDRGRERVKMVTRGNGQELVKVHGFGFRIASMIVCVEVYMHQFWDSIHKHDTSYRFRMDKKKRFYLSLETFRDIFQICPRVHGQDFNELPIDEFVVFFFKELGHTKEIKSITNRSQKEREDVLPSIHQSYYSLLPYQRQDSLLEKQDRRRKKVTVDKRKRIELLSEVALTEEDQLKEVRKKSTRDFLKTHPSGSGKVTKIPPSAKKIKPSFTNKGTGAKPGVSNVTEEESTERSDSEHETNENETGFEYDQQENEEEVEDDEEEKEDEFVKTPSNYTPTDDEDETNVESKVEDNAEGDEDKGIDYTTNQFDDDVDVRLNDPIHADEGFVQKEDIPHEDANFVSPMEVHVYHEVLSSQTPTLVIVPVTVITESSLVYTTTIPQSLPSFTPLPPLSTPTPPPTTKATNPLSALLDFYTYEAATLLTEFKLKKILIDKMDKSQSYLTTTPHRECYDGLIKSYDLDKNQEGNLGNNDEEPMREVSSKHEWFTKPKQPQEPINPDRNVGKTPQQGLTQRWLMTLSATTDKPSKTFDELMSTPIDFSAYIMNGLNITNPTQETLLGTAFKLLKGIRTNFAMLKYDFKECYKALSEKLDWDNPAGGDYPFDLTKPLPLVMNGNRQIVPVN
nr:hypothetical protein [Tanacetum cinerariifolium]